MIIVCLYIFIGCNNKKVKAQQTEEQLVIPAIPQTILDILETEPDNYNYQLVKNQLETFRMGLHSIGLALEEAIYSGNERLVFASHNNDPAVLQLLIDHVA
jgi:hypothetical protein